MLISVVLAGVVATCAIETGLDQTSIDRTFKPAVQDCRGFDRSKEISSVCPGMAAACQRAEWVDGRESATIAQTLRDPDDYGGRQLRSDFGHGDLLPLAPTDLPLTIADRETAVSRLRLETPLSFGVPEQRLALLVPTASAATENVKTTIAKEQIVANAALQPQRAADEPLSRAMRTFPAMGSALSFLAWSAAIFVLLAAGVGLSRGLHQ